MSTREMAIEVMRNIKHASCNERGKNYHLQWGTPENKNRAWELREEIGYDGNDRGCPACNWALYLKIRNHLGLPPAKDDRPITKDQPFDE